MVRKFRLSCSRVYKYQTLFCEFFFCFVFFFIFERFMQVYCCVAKSPLNYIEARIIYINDHIMKRLFSNNKLSINYYFTAIILYGTYNIIIER